MGTRRRKVHWNSVNKYWSVIFRSPKDAELTQIRAFCQIVGGAGKTIRFALCESRVEDTPNLFMVDRTVPAFSALMGEQGQYTFPLDGVKVRRNVNYLFKMGTLDFSKKRIKFTHIEFTELPDDLLTFDRYVENLKCEQ